MSPTLVLAIIVVDGFMADLKQPFTLTSVTDGNHMPGSRHYDGLAFDFRIFDLRGIVLEVLCQRIYKALAGQFDVVLEKDHIHVELK